VTEIKSRILQNRYFAFRRGNWVICFEDYVYLYELDCIHNHCELWWSD